MRVRRKSPRYRRGATDRTAALSLESLETRLLLSFTAGYWRGDLSVAITNVSRPTQVMSINIDSGFLLVRFSDVDQGVGVLEQGGAMGHAKLYWTGRPDSPGAGNCHSDAFTLIRTGLVNQKMISGQDTSGVIRSSYNGSFQADYAIAQGSFQADLTIPTCDEARIPETSQASGTWRSKGSWVGDLAATEAIPNDKGGVDVTFTVQEHRLAKSTRVEAYWAKGPSESDALSHIVGWDTGVAIGDFEREIETADLRSAPGQATHIILVADPTSQNPVAEIDRPNGLIQESSEENNVVALPFTGPPGLVVTSLGATTSGFTAELSDELDTRPLNLFDSPLVELGSADVVLSGARSGLVAGSLVADSQSRQMTFIKTGGPLAANTYSVILRSAADGFKDTRGGLLDGDSNGVTGDDFHSSFTVAEPSASSTIVSLPDFVRGPGQAVHLPANGEQGLPLTISEGTGVRNVALQVRYDPALLSITGATAGPTMPPGATVALDASVTGNAVLTFSSPTDLPPGQNVFVRLQASVPASSADSDYGRQQIVDLHSVVVTASNSDLLPVIVDDALHVVAYFGDVTGNGRINALDAGQVARVATLFDSGFAATPLTDPMIVGDISGNQRINAADASRLAQFNALVDVPEIPPIPEGIVIADLTGRPALAGVVIMAPPLSPPLSPAQSLWAATDNGLQDFTAPSWSPTAPDGYRPAVDRVMAGLHDWRVPAGGNLLSNALLAEGKGERTEFPDVLWGDG